MKSPHEWGTAHPDQSATLEPIKNQSSHAKRVWINGRPPEGRRGRRSGVFRRKGNRTERVSSQHKEAWVVAVPSHGSNFRIILYFAGKKQPCKTHFGRWKAAGMASRPVASICSQEKKSDKTRFGPTQKAIGWDSFNRQPLWRGIIPYLAGEKQPCKARLGQ